jgi:hypothetical protein
MHGIECRKIHCNSDENSRLQLVEIRRGSNGGNPFQITELSDDTFRYQEIKAKDQRKGRTSRRRKSKVSEYCGQHASFPILNTGKASVPHFDLFRNIIHPELLS